MSFNSFHRRRGVVLAAVLSLSMLVPGSFRMAHAQPPVAPPPATAPPADTVPASTSGGKRVMRANPVTEALKGLELTTDQKSKIKEIRAQSRKDIAAVTDRRSPEGMAKVRDINKKQVDDIKASLPADLQTRFQTAYDAAVAKSPAGGAGVPEALGLRDFKAPLAVLNLTPAEQAKVDPIARDAYDKIVEMRKDRTLKRADRSSKTETIITDMKTQVRPLLTTAQQTQLDTLDLKPKNAPGGGRRRLGAGGAPPAP